jgi:hypothetical protein
METSKARCHFNFHKCFYENLQVLRFCVFYLTTLWKKLYQDYILIIPLSLLKGELIQEVLKSTYRIWTGTDHLVEMEKFGIIRYNCNLRY